eukprot:g32770.t1
MRHCDVCRAAFVPGYIQRLCPECGRARDVMICFLRRWLAWQNLLDLGAEGSVVDSVYSSDYEPESQSRCSPMSAGGDSLAAGQEENTATDRNEVSPQSYISLDASSLGRMPRWEGVSSPHWRSHLEIPPMKIPEFKELQAPLKNFELEANSFISGGCPRKADAAEATRQEQRRVWELLSERWARPEEKEDLVRMEKTIDEAARRLMEQGQLDDFGELSAAPAEVRPGLWIGSEEDAGDEEFLARQGIRAVLNCTEEMACDRRKNIYERLGIQHWHLAMYDDPSEDLLAAVDKARPWLKEMLNANLENLPENPPSQSDPASSPLSPPVPVLVHCFVGGNRSVAVVVSYLVLEESMTLLEALRLCASARGRVLGSGSFPLQLLRLANGTTEQVENKRAEKAQVVRSANIGMKSSLSATPNRAVGMTIRIDEVYSTAIKACARKACWEHSLQLLRDSLEEALQPDLVFFSGVASACEKTSKWTKVLELFMEEGELLWALIDAGDLDGLKKLNPQKIDWSMLHTERGYTLLIAAVNHGTDIYADQDQGERALKIIEWLISSGASTSQKCSPKSKYRLSVGSGEKEMEVHYAGHSAVSFVAAWREQLRNKPQHSKRLSFLGNVLNCFATATSSKGQRPRVSIDEGIAELWEKYLGAKDSHDLTIEAADGSVTAHAQMLKEASPVIRAMLASPMKERHNQRIEVKDTPSSGVSLFLEILYTCSTQGDPDYKTALHALDLAHRWQVDVVVPILADLLPGMITDESFQSIAEHAILQGLERVKAASQRMRALAIQPNVISQNAALTACEKGQEWLRALDMWRGGFGELQRSLVSFNAAISACEKGVAWEEALELQNGLEENHIEADAISFVAALGACEKASHWVRTLRLLGQLTAEIDIGTYNCAISACTKRRRLGRDSKGFEHLLEAAKAQLPNRRHSKALQGHQHNVPVLRCRRKLQRIGGQEIGCFGRVGVREFVDT